MKWIDQYFASLAADDEALNIVSKANGKFKCIWPDYKEHSRDDLTLIPLNKNDLIALKKRTSAFGKFKRAAHVITKSAVPCVFGALTILTVTTGISGNIMQSVPTIGKIAATCIGITAAFFSLDLIIRGLWYGYDSIKSVSEGTKAAKVMLEKGTRPACAIPNMLPCRKEFIPQ